MTERADTDYHRHIFIFAYLQEIAQAAVAAPVEHTLVLFDMIPKYICGYYIYTTFFHLPHRSSPLASRHAGIVNLTHYRHHAFAVDDEAFRVPRYLRHGGIDDACRQESCRQQY